MNISPTNGALVLGQVMDALGIKPGTGALSTVAILMAATITEAAHADERKVQELIDASADAMRDLSKIMVSNAMKSLDPMGHS
jgi:hypothetical protein